MLQLGISVHTELGSVFVIWYVYQCSDDIVERLDSSMNHIMPNFDII